MRRPKAFMLHGFIGVGKTTLARRLERDQPAVRFSHDAWMRRLYGHDPPVAHFQDYASRVTGLMEQVWTRCLDLGSSVVLDCGFWSRAERVRVRAIIEDHGGDAVLYRLTCPDAVAWSRVERRNSRRDDGLYIARDTYHRLKTRFEPLGADEVFIGPELERPNWTDGGDGREPA